MVSRTHFLLLPIQYTVSESIVFYKAYILKLREVPSQKIGKVGTPDFWFSKMYFIFWRIKKKHGLELINFRFFSFILLIFMSLNTYLFYTLRFTWWIALQGRANAHTCGNHSSIWASFREVRVLLTGSSQWSRWRTYRRTQSRHAWTLDGELRALA